MLIKLETPGTVREDIQTHSSIDRAHTQCRFLRVSLKSYPNISDKTAPVPFVSLVLLHLREQNF